jgi:hypothetical protein
MIRRAGIAALGFALAGGFYLLLIDTTDLPELYVLAAVALAAAVAFEGSRELGFAEAAMTARWLLRAWRVLARVPVDVVRVSGEALVQLVARKPVRGSLRAIPFHGGDRPRDLGRIALTETLGSFAPNTIVLGVDPDSELMLVHQLRTAGASDELDVLRLGRE